MTDTYTDPMGNRAAMAVVSVVFSALMASPVALASAASPSIDSVASTGAYTVCMT